MSKLLRKITALACAAVMTASFLSLCSFALAEAPEDGGTVAEEALSSPFFEVSAEREAGERLTYSLDGVWETVQSSEDGAEADLTSRVYSATVKASDLSDEDVVLLELPGAEFEYSVYVNGILAVKTEASYVGTTINITGYGELSVTEDSGDEFTTAEPEEIIAEEPEILFDIEIVTQEDEFTGGANLIISGELYVQAVKTSYDLESGRLSIAATVHNYSERGLAGSLDITVYELGTVVGGVSSVRNGTGFVSRKFDVASAGSRELADIVISLRDFGRGKYWSPENPYLYEIVLKTGSDTESVRIGMRDFGVNAEEGNHIELNGEPFFIAGITVNFEQLIKAGTASAEDITNPVWVKALFDGMKSYGLTAVKSAAGMFPSVWYDIADEYGVLLITEYKLGEGAGRSERSVGDIKEEVFGIIDMLYNHPSVVMWDMSCGTEDGALVAGVTAAVSGYDLQNRPFDCGFSAAPVSETDIIECDVSALGEETSVIEGEMTAANGKITYYPENLAWKIKDYANPKIITNFGVGKYTAEELAILTEYLRVQRSFAGLMVPADVIGSDEGRAAAEALTPIGLVIEYYQSNNGRGDSMSFDVAVLNDTAEEVTDLEVTVVLRVGNDILFSETKEYDSIKKYGTDGRDIARRKFDMAVPAYIADNTEAVLEARFTLNGQTVKSSRSLTISGGVAYESPYSTLFVAGAVCVCALLIGTASVVAWGKVRHNAYKNKNKG